MNSRHARSAKESIIDLLGQILAAKKANPLADTSSDEHKIDALVYAALWANR